MDLFQYGIKTDLKRCWPIPSKNIFLVPSSKVFVINALLKYPIISCAKRN